LQNNGKRATRPLFQGVAGIMPAIHEGFVTTSIHNGLPIGNQSSKPFILAQKQWRTQEEIQSFIRQGKRNRRSG